MSAAPFTNEHPYLPKVLIQQMRLIHRIPFDSREIEGYRQLVFNNLTRGMQALLESMDDMDIKLSENHQDYVELIANAPDLRDGESFPLTFYEPLKTLWADARIQEAWQRGNEAALPEKWVSCMSPSLSL